MNNVIIIGQTITINASAVNANYSNSFAEFIGTVSEAEPEPEPEPELILELYAFGEYQANNNSINIEWNSTITKGIFDIQISDDNDTYTSIGKITDDSSYNHVITDPFEKKIF